MLLEFVNKNQEADTTTCLCFAYAHIIVCIYLLFVTHMRPTLMLGYVQCYYFDLGYGLSVFFMF